MSESAARTRRSPRRILIIKPSSLGDVVHALPVLAGLRRAYPQAHIAWLIATPFAPLLDGHPLLNELIPFDRRGYGQMLRRPAQLRQFLRFLASLRRRRFDLVLDLQGLFRSGFLAWASGAPQRVGFADARELAPLFYTRRIAGRRTACHAVEVNLRLARALDLPVDPPTFPLALQPDEFLAAQTLLSQAAGRPLDHFIAVIPGARWPSKRWPSEHTAALLDRLHPEGLPPAVLLGGPDDRAPAADVRRRCAAPTVDLTGRTTLRQLAALIALSDLVICQDSGPMHIAAALGKPLVALFGPTNPTRTGPYGPAARVVQLPLACAPCYERQCPLGHHQCMRTLSADTVAAHVREMWTARSQPAPAR